MQRSFLSWSLGVGHRAAIRSVQIDNAVLHGSLCITEIRPDRVGGSDQLIADDRALPDVLKVFQLAETPMVDGIVVSESIDEV